MDSESSLGHRKSRACRLPFIFRPNSKRSALASMALHAFISHGRRLYHSKCSKISRTGRTLVIFLFWLIISFKHLDGTLKCVLCESFISLWRGDLCFFCLHKGLVDVYLMPSWPIQVVLCKLWLTQHSSIKYGVCKYQYHAAQAVMFIRWYSVSYPNIHAKHLW